MQKMTAASIGFIGTLSSNPLTKKGLLMNARRIGMMWAALGLITVVLILGGCNTWEGAGKDVERAGEKMQGD